MQNKKNSPLKTKFFLKKSQYLVDKLSKFSKYISQGVPLPPLHKKGDGKVWFSGQQRQFLWNLKSYFDEILHEG